MFLENKSDRIIKGIFIGGILYFIGHVLIFLTTLSSATSEIGYYIWRMYFMFTASWK